MTRLQHTMFVEDARSAYDGWHTRYDVDAEANTPWHRLVRQHLDPARDIEAKHVLEVGSGRGGFAYWLATQAPKPATLIAVDFARTALRKGKEFSRGRGILTIRWALGDILSLPHAGGSFDTVISCETIEHVIDPSGALRELARVLRPGGRLFLTAPNYFGMMGLYRVYLRLTGRRFREEGQPINHPLVLPRTMAWVRRTGLKVVGFDGVGHYLPFPGRPSIEIPLLNHPRYLMRWFALHSLVIAEKPSAQRHSQASEDGSCAHGWPDTT